MIQFSHTHFTLHGSLFREKLPSDLWILKTWTTLLKGIKVSFHKVKFHQTREEFLKQGDFPECSIVHKTIERMNVPGSVLRTMHTLTHLSLWQPYEVLLWSQLQWGNWGTAIPAPRRGRDWTRQSGSWAILNLPCKPLDNILLSIPLQLCWSFVVFQLYPFFLPLICCRGWKWETPLSRCPEQQGSSWAFPGGGTYASQMPKAGSSHLQQQATGRLHSNSTVDADGGISTVIYALFSGHQHLPPFMHLQPFLSWKPISFLWSLSAWNM